ncbi:MAG: alpha/beta hydrolase [Gemmatimonadetes bacterium]|nr:MAG: alpha/beta hydrolase [Gemmatimonadota bacterium]
MIERRFTLTSARNEPIRGDIRYQETTTPLPVVVISHGFKGFKDWGFHPYLGRRLAEAGYCAIHYNFSRNGIGDDLLNFTELDKFRENTFSVEIDDLYTVVDALEQEFTGDPLDLSRLALMGHSRGGGIAILGASHLPEVSCLVTWSAVSTFDRYQSDPQVIDMWRKQGYLEVKNARTGQILQMGVELVDDYLRDPDRFDILDAAASLEIPYGIIHGTADETVPFAEAEALHRHARHSTLIPIDGAGHTFGATHPWGGTTDHLERAIQETIMFFDQHLN